LKRIAKILRDNGPSDAGETLLRAVTLNVVLGNGDAHAKNFSLLHHPLGTFRLTPLYDLMSTLYYGDDRLAMHIDNVRRTNRVTADRIVNEAVGWGMSRRRAVDVVTDFLERTPAAIDAAQLETEGLPPEIRATVDAQLAQVRSEFEATPKTQVTGG